MGDTPISLRNPDFAVRSLRSNVVLRWEWKAGSTLYVVWQQDHERRAVTSARAGFDDLFGSFAIPGRTVLAVKSSFWVPVSIVGTPTNSLNFLYTQLARPAYNSWPPPIPISRT